MHNNQLLNDILKKIKSSKTSLVFAHQNPDGDTLGSMLAIGALLKQMGHKVDHVISDPVPEVFQFLPFADLVKTPDSSELLQKYDMAYSLDCGSLKRLGKAGDLWKLASTTVNLDHHISNEKFADINWIEPDATSTGQVVYWFAKGASLNITSEIATLLYTTLLTDTGCFSNSNTNAEAMKWSSELIQLGADHLNVYKRVFLERPYRAMKIFGSALNNMEKLENGRIIWTSVDRQLMESLGATSEDTEDIVDYMTRIKGVEICAFFREDVNETKVSLRSNTNIDVSKIAVSMGGGGHKRAAGINIKKPFKEVKSTILDRVTDEVKQSEKVHGKR